MENKEKEEKNTTVEVDKKEDKKSKKAKVNKEVEQLKESLQASEDKCLRLQAEFINFRNRHNKEIEAMAKYEGEELIKRLLPIIDDFERAIKLDDNDLGDEVSKFLSGIKMIYGNLIAILESLEVKEIDVLGREFDPVYAEAVITESDESKPSNVVLEVFTKGYIYKDKVIRPAMVKVNK